MLIFILEKILAINRILYLNYVGNLDKRNIYEKRVVTKVFVVILIILKLKIKHLKKRKSRNY